MTDNLAAALDKLGPDIEIHVRRIGGNFQAGIQDRGSQQPNVFEFRGGETPSEALLAACAALPIGRPGTYPDIDDLI